MQYHSLENYHLKLSEICFGGAAISGEGRGYGFGKISEKDAIELIFYAFEKGINFFDTAPIYGFMESEKRLAQALKSIREKVAIVSKCGVDWHENLRVNMSNDPKVCQKMLDSSLSLHGYLDVYMIHWPDAKIDIRYPLEVLQKAHEKKDILAIGLCNTTQDDLKKAQEVCHISVIQNEVNLFQNKNEELDFDGLKMGWGTFDKGILTGSVTEDKKFDADDCRSWAPWWKKSNWKQKVQKVEKLKKFTHEQGYTLLEMALAYSLKEGSINSALCGFKTQEQLDQILKALTHLPEKEVLIKAKEMLE